MKLNIFKIVPLTFALDRSEKSFETRLGEFIDFFNREREFLKESLKEMNSKEKRNRSKSQILKEKESKRKKEEEKKKRKKNGVQRVGTQTEKKIHDEMRKNVFKKKMHENYFKNKKLRNKEIGEESKEKFVNYAKIKVNFISRF